MSYRQMSQNGALSGLEISAQGLEQKFSERSAEFMQRMLEQAVAQLVQVSLHKDNPLLERFTRIHIQDGSVIGLPDECVGIWQGVRPPHQKGRSAVKLHVSLEYKSGRVDGPRLAPGREHDQRSPFFQRTLQAGELRIVDLGFFDLEQLEKDAQAGGFWVIRHKQNGNRSGVYLAKNMLKPPDMPDVGASICSKTCLAASFRQKTTKDPPDIGYMCVPASNPAHIPPERLHKTFVCTKTTKNWIWLLS
jgi:hypothetical protein